MANAFIGGLNGAPTLIRLLAFEKFDEPASTEYDSFSIEMTALDGSVLTLTGNFTSTLESDWEIYSLSYSDGDTSLASISGFALPYAEYEAMSGKQLMKSLFSGDDDISLNLGTGLEIRSLAGDDVVRLGTGNDTAWGGAGNDTLTGGEGDDRLLGGRGRDLLRGEDGSDELIGGGGRDKIAGGSENDTLFGNKGSDKLFGGSGNDTLQGGGGQDTLTGGQSDDLLTGGAGADVFMFRRNDHTDVITDFEIGIDKIHVKSGASGMNGVDFDQQGEDVFVYFGNVTVTVQNTTVEQLDDGSNFLF
ncbi:calcium-binding protein [Leisingera caerulea]|uniref:Calcium-binding protein n=1 Tax=Leisingera caerulea TaxID=506591 RepID=A0A9Q9HJM8_LEICA|nr:calcium-binding protein [Leisingera caerulea]UWQ53440.1 calcium-binding protein [Leisingera caerulea]